MSIHSLIDNLAVGTGALFMPKYYREGHESVTIAEHLNNISMTFPDVQGAGDYDIEVDTLAGNLNATFRIARWTDEKLPTIVYHHGAAETPFDYGFKRIFPTPKFDIPANLALIRAPFHRNMKDFQQGIRTLNNIAAMLAVSVHLIEHLVQYLRQVSTGKIVIAGTSLGGFITNLHHIHFNSADYYTPLLAGLAMDDAYLYSTYSKAVARSAKDNPFAIKSVLNFEKDFAKMDNSNVFPLLAVHDTLIRYEQQRASYGNLPVDIINKGHTTGALAYQALREHILKPLQKHA